MLQWGLEPDADISKLVGNQVAMSHELATSEADRSAVLFISSTAAIGRPFVAPPYVPAERVEALREFEGTMLFVSHDRHFLAALSNRVLELTPEGVHQYGGGYTEYVERTGQEAPGLHPGS